MIVSNALPIQLWQVDEDTYNESQAVCGLTDACFCQPIQRDDRIVLYIDDENPETKVVVFVNEDGEYIYVDGFDSSGFVSFIPNEQTLVEGKYQALIYEYPNAAVLVILEPSEWQDEVDTWTKNDTNNTLSIAITGGNAIVRMPLSVPDDVTFKFTVFITITGVWSGGSVTIVPFITDASGALKDAADDILTFATNVSNEIHEFEFTVMNGGGFSTDPMAFLKFNVLGPPIGTATITITIFPEQLIYIGEDAIFYKSDCLDFRTEWENCTKLITYSNYTNAFGINYEDSSPTPEFSIRVPCIFFHDQYPMEQEVHNLSNDTRVRLWNEMAHKRLLQLNLMPYYMHQKINMILMHDNIQIDGVYWDKEDAYEIIEGNWRYPLKRATVLLTERDFNKRNLI